MSSLKTKTYLSENQFSPKYLLVFGIAFALLCGIIIFRSFAANPNLPGDVNNDNVVNITDLSILLSNYGAVHAPADFNSDGVVNILDLSILLTNYGRTYTPTPPPPPPPPASGVTPPTAPSSYTVPSGVSVSTTAALLSALNGSTRDIILENGTYTHTTTFNIGTKRLWARNIGQAIIKSGIVIGGNGTTTGGEVHGLKLNITNGVGGESSAINVWGSDGPNTVIADTYIYGNRSLDSGIMVRTPSGLKVNRVVINGFKSYGLIFQTYYPNYFTDVASPVPQISDLDISAIYRDNRGSSDGTAEAGLWIGTNCQCTRVKIRDIGWMGVFTGSNTNDGFLSHFDIDNVQGTVPWNGKSVSIAVYPEHYTRRFTFKNFVIGKSVNTGIEVGFNCEWDDPAYAGRNPEPGVGDGACHFIKIEDGTIYSKERGVGLYDARNTTISRVKFVGQTRSAITDFMTKGFGQSTTWQNQGNDFSGIAPGASQYSTTHPNSD